MFMNLLTLKLHTRKARERERERTEMLLFGKVSYYTVDLISLGHEFRKEISGFGEVIKALWRRQHLAGLFKNRHLESEREILREYGGEGSSES